MQYRRQLGLKVDEDFFCKVSHEKEPVDKDELELAHQPLQKNPNIAKLLLAVIQGNNLLE